MLAANEHYGASKGFFCFINFLDGKRSIEKQIRFPGRLAIRIIYVIDCPTQLFIQVSFL